MKKQTLSIEQMLHLKEIGVDTSKASMVFIYEDEEGNILEWEEVLEELSHPEPMEMFKTYLDAESGNYDHSYRKSCGVFTLQDVLDLLPKQIKAEPLIHTFSIYINYQDNNIAYAHSDKNGYVWLNPNYDISNNLLDAAYKMLCWVVENGYLKVK